MLATRQKRLFQVRPMYDRSLQSLHDDLVQGRSAVSGVDAVRAAGTPDADCRVGPTRRRRVRRLPATPWRWTSCKMGR